MGDLETIDPLVTVCVRMTGVWKGYALTGSDYIFSSNKHLGGRSQQLVYIAPKSNSA